VQALLLLGYAIGALVYVALALAVLRGARQAVRGALVVYWRNRSRRETAAVVRHVRKVAAPPQRRAA
jgi:hypothetical protein